MGRRGEGNIDLVLNIMVFVIVGIVVIWYISNRTDTGSMNTIKENLDIVEGMINIACMYDSMNISDIQLTRIEANLTLLDNEICIKQEGAPLLCRDALCSSISEEEYNLAQKNSFMLIRNSSGVKLV